MNRNRGTFAERVYTITRAIPRGKVTTYQQVAQLAGNPKAARAVGVCMRNNLDIPHTPCHRVIKSDGRVHGYSGVGGVQSKKKMLIEEGVVFQGERVDLFQSQWDVKKE